jgi:hypothetical protein
MDFATLNPSYNFSAVNRVLTSEHQHRSANTCSCFILTHLSPLSTDALASKRIRNQQKGWIVVGRRACPLERGTPLSAKEDQS